METLIDLFEMNSTSDARPLPSFATDLYDGRSTLVEIEVDWEETFHGASSESDSSTWRGARVWLSEE